MFGFSIGKLLVLAVILFAVIYGYKMVSRLGAPQRRKETESQPANRIDTEYDPETDSYVPRKTKRPPD